MDVSLDARRPGAAATPPLRVARRRSLRSTDRRPTRTWRRVPGVSQDTTSVTAPSCRRTPSSDLVCPPEPPERPRPGVAGGVGRHRQRFTSSGRGTQWSCRARKRSVRNAFRTGEPSSLQSGNVSLIARRPAGNRWTGPEQPVSTCSPHTRAQPVTTGAGRRSSTPHQPIREQNHLWCPREQARRTASSTMCRVTSTSW